MSMASLSTLFYFILQLFHILLSFGSQSWICIKSAKIFRSTWISIRIRCYQILYWPIILQDNGLRVASTLGTALPSPLPWMFIHYKEYWYICCDSILTCCRS
nr:uncharacterized protein LOC111992376 [Quercus suber]